MALRVADTEGPIHFNIAQNDTGSSILNLLWKAFTLRTPRDCPGASEGLESLLTEIRAPRIDLLKMASRALR